MKAKQILFTAPRVVELVDVDLPEPGEEEVTVRMEYTTISAGTERANLLGDPNVDARIKKEDTVAVFPRELGYSGSGVVVKVGARIDHVAVGDRVVCIGYHKNYCNLHKSNVIKINRDCITMQEAAMTVIASFSAAGVRKTKLEMGEAAIVMGLGILGQFAIQFCRAAGAYPVIAADPIAERRAQALELGADFAVDPFAPDFEEQVKALTDGNGCNVAIEVTGKGQALDQVLDCMARQGRVSLLGCTRDSDFSIDYYRKIHYPGIVLVGAHTGVRPWYQSYPGYWCYTDEMQGIFKLIEGGRVNFQKMISETHSPNEAIEVYDRLLNDKNFPLAVQFDWSKL